MFRNSKDKKASRYAICGVLAASLVAGFAGTSTLASASSRAEKAQAKAAEKAQGAVESAEKAVQASPRDAALRSALGNAYLDAGRFDSAATTFQDAIALGDGSGSTALRLALAQIGIGRNREAVVILDMQRDAIPAGDLGLALALAGDTDRGVNILTDAIRSGDNTAKVRQNLAYAYALAGRWPEARVMASQDVPADKLGERLTSWAATSQPEAYAYRVAGLLGTQLRPDSGQPVQLALGERPADAPEMPAAPVFAVAPEPSGELPASEPSREFALAQPEAPAAPPAAPVSTGFNAAFVEAPQPAPIPFAAPQPVVRAIPAPIFAAKAVKASPKPLAGAKFARGTSHLVQLGSFSSPENARRAVKLLQSRNPELKGFELTITPAVVHGRNFWRVAAGGFNQRSAFGLCSTVKNRGGGCLAYATTRPLPGGLPAGGKSGLALARR